MSCWVVPEMCIFWCLSTFCCRAGWISRRLLWAGPAAVLCHNSMNRGAPEGQGGTPECTVFFTSFLFLCLMLSCVVPLSRSPFPPPPLHFPHKPNLRSEPEAGIFGFCEIFMQLLFYEADYIPVRVRINIQNRQRWTFTNEQALSSLPAPVTPFV